MEDKRTREDQSIFNDVMGNGDKGLSSKPTDTKKTTNRYIGDRGDSL